MSLLAYIKNTGWMLAEQLLKVLSAIIIGILVARHLGPEQYGVYSFLLAVMTISIAVVKMGMDTALVRDLSTDTTSQSRYATGTLLMLAASIIATVLLALIGILIGQLHGAEGYLLAIIAVSLIFQAGLVVDFAFQARVQAKYSAIAKSLALLLSVMVKGLLLIYQAPLGAFVVAFVIEQGLIASLLLLVAKRRGMLPNLRRFDAKLIRPMLKSAMPLMLAAIAFSLYARVDQLMIYWMLGSYELGIYAAAAKIYEGYLILPFVLCLSLIPLLTRLRQTQPEQYRLRIQQLYTLLIYASIGFAGFIYLLGEWLVLLTFGQAFLQSAAVLSVLAIAAIFTAIGTVSARVLTIEGLERKLLKLTLIGLLANIALNIILIPLLGLTGAAWATLATMIIAYIMLDYLDPDLRFLAAAKRRAILLKSP